MTVSAGAEDLPDPSCLPLQLEVRRPEPDAELQLCFESLHTSQQHSEFNFPFRVRVGSSLSESGNRRRASKSPLRSQQ